MCLKYEEHELKQLLSVMATILDGEIVDEKRDRHREGTLRKLITLNEILTEIQTRLR